ncbi:phage tail tip fiber protein [Aeromonas caviae]|uniref:phage tail tip fiber protein n=1 Tax=Aeromonas caviae TaxID=648 RepID=UPI003EC628EF
MAKKPAYRAGRDQAATAENVELLTGQRGDRLDKAVTFRELAALGLSTLRPGAGGVHVPGKNPDLFPPGQMEFPHAPVNVIANGAFHTVLVEWDPPQYRGHAHAEIWRAESDNQAEATLVGTSSANLFSDAIGKGATFYYWVRFVNGKDDKGPFQGMQGVKAETSRDVQDILDELQGKIEESHLAQTLLGPIEQVPQLQLDIAILKPKVAAIEDKIPSIEQELAGLDERQKVAQELLDDAQQQLGMSSIEIGLVQDRLNAKLDKYKGDFDSFRDAAFVVDPENGSITMDAVNAVRYELHTSITEVHQQIDAVAGQISSKADNVTVDGQGSRITEAEQRINGLDASLSQTVTRGEFTGEQQRVTQIGQELDATKGELTQKATKQEVDAQGVRLANAESKLTAHTDELSSQAQRLDGLAAQVTLGDATLQANITELARVTAESDQVTAQRVSGLEVRAGTSEAKIQALEEIIEDDGGITAGRFDTIIAELELQRGLDDDNASAAIDGALAVDERDRETRKAFGAIRTEQRVILTEQQAQAQRTTDMEVKFEAKDAATQARISSVEKVTSDADAALASQINTVSAVAGSKNKTFFQATAPGSAMGTGDLWFDTANNNRPYRYSGTAWVATDDPRIAANAAAVQLQSQAIADLQNGAQAMWTAKASAGEITAGIGLIAKSDGTSQVVVSASQFFVFNPNSPSTTAPLFAIDNGQAVIAEAIIRKATIQILNAEEITADYVKAGVSISTPLINGGQIDMGNAFLSGGAAGFGKGGPYSGWGWGWYTMIYADGSIYTNRLRAEGGYVKNMTMNNCTIDQDCVVRGTVYAERIVGDVAAIKSLYMQQPSGPFSMFFNVAQANFTRGVIVTGINISAEGYYYGSGGQPSEGTRSCTVVFYMNGVEFGRSSVSATGGSNKDSATASATVTLPAGVRGRFQVSILGDVSVSLVGAVAMVFKHGSATFE